ncbi:MAG: hypothetical protein HC817_15285 [Saprospiraceae bacterium]|nr:hypothetical protein [Saprospiraceae bacterium]
MKKKICTLLLTTSICFGYAQTKEQPKKGFFNNISVHVGYSTYSPDRRLAQELAREDVAGLLPRSLIKQQRAAEFDTDKEYSFYFTKNIINKDRFRLGLGLGYLFYKSNYFTWANQGSFGINFYPVYAMAKDGYYRKHNLLVPLSAEAKILSLSKQSELRAGFTAQTAFTIYKKIDIFNKGNYFTKNTFELNNIEINPYLKYQWHRYSISAAHRVYNFFKTDDSILTINSFRYIAHVIEYDTYNQQKFWFTLGVDLF